jgi:hypothetical protein
MVVQEARSRTDIQEGQSRMRDKRMQKVEGAQEVFANDPRIIGDRGQTKGAIPMLQFAQIGQKLVSRSSSRGRPAAVKAVAAEPR